MQTHRLSDRGHRVLQLEEYINDIRPLCAWQSYGTQMKKCELLRIRSVDKNGTIENMIRVRKLKLTASALNCTADETTLMMME